MACFFFFLFHVLSRSKLSDVVEPEKRRCNEEKLCDLCFSESSLYQVSRREQKTSSWLLMWRVAVSILSMLSTSKRILSQNQSNVIWLGYYFIEFGWIHLLRFLLACHAIFLPNERLLGRKDCATSRKSVCEAGDGFTVRWNAVISDSLCLALSGMSRWWSTMTWPSPLKVSMTFGKFPSC